MAKSRLTKRERKRLKKIIDQLAPEPNPFLQVLDLIKRTKSVRRVVPSDPITVMTANGPMLLDTYAVELAPAEELDG